MAAEQEKKLRLGGMALRNGLLIHGPTHWAAAVRDSGGEIEVASERKPELAPKLASRVPGLRGPLKLAEAIVVLPLVRRRMRSARMPFEDPRVIGALEPLTYTGTMLTTKSGEFPFARLAHTAKVQETVFLGTRAE
ncbi:MAG TPA: hypothetical protein VGI73_06055, partial [Solirubrobacterales bacterium]